jgi:adenylate kinase family enzyme
VASHRILGSSPARAILVVGGPGSGKGLLCSRLVAECGVSHVSCGDMLREEVQRSTPLGIQVRKTPRWPRSWPNFSPLQLYSHRNAWASLHLLGQPNSFLARQCAEIMQRGELVSSEVITTLLRRRMREFPGRRLLLDGFPRSRQVRVPRGPRVELADFHPQPRLRCTTDT